MNWKPEQNFMLGNARDALDMLIWQHSELKRSTGEEPHIAAYRIIQCAITAWQLCDWVWRSLPPEARANYLSQIPPDSTAKIELNRFRTWARKACSQLNVCRVIADASKHVEIDREPDPTVETISVEWVSKERSYCYWALIDGDRQLLSAPKLIERVIEFWTEQLNRHGINRRSEKAVSLSVYVRTRAQNPDESVPHATGK